jgi:hypothetical protein
LIDENADARGPLPTKVKAATLGAWPPEGKLAVLAAFEAVKGRVPYSRFLSSSLFGGLSRCNTAKTAKTAEFL